MPKRIPVKLYTRLLAAYPREFRDRFATGMIAAFAGESCSSCFAASARWSRPARLSVSA
jgi:hypothetical protein